MSTPYPIALECAVIMITLGIGAFMRGAAPVVFAGIPPALVLPISPDPMAAAGVLLSREKLVAAAVAALCVAGVSWFFRRSRAGLALRAIADDQPAALAAGMNVPRYFALAWGLMGALSVLAGTLWTLVAGGGFGVVLVGLRVFPIVIIAVLFARPYGLFGRPDVERV